MLKTINFWLNRKHLLLLLAFSGLWQPAVFGVESAQATVEQASAEHSKFDLKAILERLNQTNNPPAAIDRKNTNIYKALNFVEQGTNLVSLILQPEKLLFGDFGELLTTAGAFGCVAYIANYQSDSPAEQLKNKKKFEFCDQSLKKLQQFNPFSSTLVGCILTGALPKDHWAPKAYNIANRINSVVHSSAVALKTVYCPDPSAENMDKLESCMNLANTLYKVYCSYPETFRWQQHLLLKPALNTALGIALAKFFNVRKEPAIKYLVGRGAQDVTSGAIMGTFDFLKNRQNHVDKGVITRAAQWLQNEKKHPYRTQFINALLSIGIPLGIGLPTDLATSFAIKKLREYKAKKAAQRNKPVPKIVLTPAVSA